MGRKPEGKAEKTFKKFGVKIDEMIADLQKLKEKARENYGDRFEEMDRNAEKLKDEFNQFKERNKDKWDEVEDKLEKAGKELAGAFKTAFSKKTETKN